MQPPTYTSFNKMPCLHLPVKNLSKTLEPLSDKWYWPPYFIIECFFSPNVYFNEESTVKWKYCKSPWELHWAPEASFLGSFQVWLINWHRSSHTAHTLFLSIIKWKYWFSNGQNCLLCLHYWHTLSVAVKNAVRTDPQISGIPIFLSLKVKLTESETYNCFL